MSEQNNVIFLEEIMRNLLQSHLKKFHQNIQDPKTHYPNLNEM